MPAKSRTDVLSGAAIITIFAKKESFRQGIAYSDCWFLLTGTS